MKKLQSIVILIVLMSCGKLSPSCMNNEFKPSQKVNTINELLYKSLIGNKLNVAKILILRQANLHKQIADKIGNTPVHIIAENGYDDLIDYIYKCYPKIKKLNLEVKNKIGETPLWSAYRGNKKSTFIKLIQRGADVNSCRKNNESLFYVACSQKNPLFAKILAFAQANPNLITTHGDVSINWIARNGHKELFVKIETLYGKKRIKYRINYLNSNCLFIALNNNKYEIFKTFLELGVSPAKILNNNKEDILSIALKQNKRKYFKEALKYANINTPYTTNGDTILHKIARKGNKHDLELISTFVQKELLKSIPNYDQSNKLNETPLYLAYKKNNLVMFECILKQEINADQLIPNKNHTLLKELIVNKKNTFAKALIKKSKRLYMQINDSGNNTPIHLIVKLGNVELLRDIGQMSKNKEIKPYKIDLSIENGKGETPLFVSYKNKNLLMFATLLSLGSNPDQLTTNKLLPLKTIIKKEIKKTSKKVNKNYGTILNKLIASYSKNENIINTYKKDLGLYIYMLEQCQKIKQGKNRYSSHKNYKNRSITTNTDGLKNIASWHNEIPEHLGAFGSNIKKCINNDKRIQQSAEGFYRQLNSPTCGFNAIARLISLKYGTIKFDNYCGYILHVLYNLHKKEVDNIVNVVDSSSNLQKTNVFTNVYCRIKDISKKLKFKGESDSKKNILKIMQKKS